MEVEVSLNGLDATDIVVECVLGRENDTGQFITERCLPFDLAENPAANTARFHGELFKTAETCLPGGQQDFKLRIYPCHDLLSHPFECGRMTWL